MAVHSANMVSINQYVKNAVVVEFANMERINKFAENAEVINSAFTISKKHNA
jgi:hypothetical protein